MRTLIALIIASVFVAMSPLALAEIVHAEPATIEASAIPAPADSSTEDDKSAARADAIGSIKSNSASELPTCVPK